VTDDESGAPPIEPDDALINIEERGGGSQYDDDD
jgi:hypothetical protein